MRHFFSGRITVKMTSVSHKKLTLDFCASNVRIFLWDMYPPPFGAYIKICVLLLGGVLLVDGLNLVLHQLHVVLQLLHLAVHLVNE